LDNTISAHLDSLRDEIGQKLETLAKPDNE
jgi:hypothetical protein